MRTLALLVLMALPLAAQFPPGSSRARGMARMGAAVPAACSVGDLYMLVQPAPAPGVCGCTAPGVWTCAVTGAGSGTVTSVGLALPAMFSVTGSPVTSAGTLSAALVTQTMNTVLAGPVSGGAAVPTFRALVSADAPTHAARHQHGGNDEVATATPAANAIPKAGGGGTLAAAWIPTLNQNTSGTAGGLAAAYIDWNAGSGGTSILNRPTLGAMATGAYPGAGVAVSTGSAWGASLAAPAGVLVGTTAVQDLTSKTLTVPIVRGYTVATLPATGTAGRVAAVTDAATAGNCAAGGGAALALCRDSGTAWVALGDGGGTGNVVGTTGSGLPVANCTAGQAVYTDTVTSRVYHCVATNTWRELLSSGTGTGVVTMREGTAPGAGAAAGEHNMYFASATSRLQSHENGGPVVTYSITVAAGTAALGTASIASGACATTVTVGATGVLTSDVIDFTPNADLVAVTGYSPVTTGGLSIYPFPTAGNVNFRVCNPTLGAITPGAVTLNWVVTR